MSNKGKVLIAIAAIGGVILAIVAIVNKITNGDSDTLHQSNL